MFAPGWESFSPDYNLRPSHHSPTRLAHSNNWPHHHCWWFLRRGNSHHLALLDYDFVTTFDQKYNKQITYSINDIRSKINRRIDANELFQRLDELKKYFIPLVILNTSIHDWNYTYFKYCCIHYSEILLYSVKNCVFSHSWPRSASALGTFHGCPSTSHN